MTFKELRKHAEIRRWCREHPEVDWYSDRTGCGAPVCGIGLVLAVVLLLVGCKTKYVPVEVIHTDTMVVTQHHRDSVYLHDSTFVMQAGDTVRIEKWRTQVRWREVHDTTYIAKVDSLPYFVEVAMPSPQTEHMSWWKRTLMWFGGVALLLGVGFVGALMWNNGKTRK